MNVFTTPTHIVYHTGHKYITSVGGRLRRPEIIFAKNKHVQNVLNKTQIVNFPIQATCTDFLKTSFIILFNLYQSIVLTAHIVLECEKPQIQQLLENVMIVATIYYNLHILLLV